MEELKKLKKAVIKDINRAEREMAEIEKKYGCVISNVSPIAKEWLMANGVSKEGIRLLDDIHNILENRQNTEDMIK